MRQTVKAGAEFNPRSQDETPSSAVGMGCLGLLVLAILDFVTIGIGGSGYCGTAPRWTYIVLLLVPVVVGIGGVGSLVIAGRRHDRSAQLRKGLRILGVIAIAFMLLSAVVNLVSAFSWSFCMS